MTTYRAEGFTFNRDNIKGVGADMLGSLNRFLAARERELNSFELETLTCSGGPLDGQTIELTAPHADAVDCQGSYAELMRTAVFTLRGMTGHYQKHMQKEGRAAVWVPEGGALPEKSFFYPKAKATSKTAAPAKLGRGFTLLQNFLAKMAEQPETVEHAGQVFAIFKIGRTQYRIKNTPEAIEKLRAAILKKKKWFADRLIDAPREPLQAPDTIHARAAQDVARVIAQATYAAQQQQEQESTAEPAPEPATVGANLESAQDQPHQLHEARIAQTLRSACDKTTTAPLERAALYTKEAQRIRAAGDAMQDRAGQGRIAQTYHAAADILQRIAEPLRAVDKSTGAGAAGDGLGASGPAACSPAVPKMRTTPTPARPRGQAQANYTRPCETLRPRRLHTGPRDLGGGAIMPAMNYPEHMTGAELQTLREACGLDREEFADLANVQARTLKHWENGRTGVPADVAQLARELDAACTQGAAAMLERVQFEALGAPEGQPLVLVRYKVPADMPQGQNMPAGLQGAMVARVRLELLRKGRAVRVVWHDAGQGGPLEQLQAQALPHRGDQPPAA